MKYRVLGRTGLKVSEIGFGAHEYRRPLPTTLGEWGEIDSEQFMKTQPPRAGLIKKALDAGVNFFDTTQTEEAKSLGIVLEELGTRDKMHVAAMLIWPFRGMQESLRPRWRELILQGVEERLRLLRTDYVDVLNIHIPEDNYSPDRLETALKALEETKKQGKIRWIGASSHEPKFLAELMRKHDCFDTIMVRYNYHLQEAREALFPLYKALDVGVVVMKPLTWPYYGIPFMRFAPDTAQGMGHTPAQTSLRWVLSSPEVSTTVPGMNDEKELIENLGASAPAGRTNEDVLKQSLLLALGEEGRERLARMLDDPAIDILHFAKNALTGEQ